MSEISKEFKKWAKGLSGCDGGDIKNAKVWVCGIEWGGMNSDKESLQMDIEEGVKLNNGYKWEEHQKYTYGRSLAKLYTAIYNDDCKDEKDLEEYQNYINKLENNEVFRLNLYPVAFKDTSHQYWHDNDLKEITGFASKYLYQLWCFFNRFPEFLKLRKEHEPELIICTGVDYLRDFLRSFVGDKNIEDIEVGTLKGQSTANNHERAYYYVKTGKTLVVVIPFFSGSRGLNSYYLLNKMGKKIKEELVKK